MRRSALIIMAMLTLAAGSVAIIATGPRAMSKEPRFSQLTMDQLTDQQKPLANQIMKVSSVVSAAPTIRSCAVPYSGKECSICCITCAGKHRCL